MPQVKRAVEAEADLTGAAKAAGLKFSAETRVEFDGFVKVDLAIAPAGKEPAKVEGLYLEVALPEAEATHFCATAGGWTAVHDVLPDRWTSQSTASGDASAVPALAALLKDPGGLGRFASLALGRIGAAATPTLLGLAAEKERRWVERALRALTQYGDPAATATVLSLTESPEASIRGLAARALGSRPSLEGTAQLIALLEDKQDQVVCAACASLGRLRDRTAIEALVDLHVRTKNNSVHEAAGRALEAITGLEYGPYAARWKKALDEGLLEGKRN